MMSRTVTSPEQFITIGENIHTTRVVRRNGARATTLPGGVEAVVYKDENGGAAPDRSGALHTYAALRAG